MKKRGDMSFDIFFLATMFFILGTLFVVTYTKTDKLVKDFGDIQKDILNMCHDLKETAEDIDKKLGL